MSKKKGAHDERANQDHSSRISPDSSDHPSHASLEDVGWLDLGEDSDSFSELGDIDFDSLDLGSMEDSLSFSPSALPAFDQAAQSSLSHLKKRRRSNSLASIKRSYKADEITDEDFEDGPERKAFQIIRHHADILLEQQPSALTKPSLTFFFGGKRADEIRFDLCCDVLGARADILRLRLVYEWWKRGTMFNGPMDFDVTPYPELLTGEILHHGNLIGVEIATEVWNQPGITTPELFHIFQVPLTDDHEPTEKKGVAIKKALENLNAYNLISKNAGWYLTGRNPMISQMREQSKFGRDISVGGSYYWSRFFN